MVPVPPVLGCPGGAATGGARCAGSARCRLAAGRPAARCPACASGRTWSGTPAAPRSPPRWSAADRFLRSRPVRLPGQRGPGRQRCVSAGGACPCGPHDPRSAPGRLSSPPPARAAVGAWIGARTGRAGRTARPGGWAGRPGSRAAGRGRGHAAGGGCAGGPGWWPPARTCRPLRPGPDHGSAGRSGWPATRDGQYPRPAQRGVSSPAARRAARHRPDAGRGQPPPGCVRGPASAPGRA